MSSQLTDETQKHTNYKNFHEMLFDENQSLRNIADVMVRADYNLGANIQVNTGIVTFGSRIGSMLPFILQRVDFGPASASAPLMAILVDVLGLVIYFLLPL